MFLPRPKKTATSQHCCRAHSWSAPTPELPYPNNQIPVDAVAQNIAKKYMPLPNTNQNGLNYADVTSGNETVNQYLARVDHKINDNNQLAIHFLYA